MTVTKDGQTVKFCVNNITSGCSDSFSVSNDAYYNSSNCSVGCVITSFNLGAFLEFGFGTFRVGYDYKDGLVRLDKGSFKDALTIEKSDFPIGIKSATELKVNTLSIEKVAVFKNEGILEAFVTVLRDCPTVENRGKFHSRNLFLLNTYIQNYDMVICNDARKESNGGINRKIPNPDHPEKGGCIRMESPTGNTLAMTELVPEYANSMNGEASVLCGGFYVPFKGHNHFSYILPKKGNYTVILFCRTYCNANDGTLYCTNRLGTVGKIEFSVGNGFNKHVFVSRFCNIEDVTLRFNKIVHLMRQDPAPALYLIYDNPSDYTTL